MNPRTSNNLGNQPVRGKDIKESESIKVAEEPRTLWMVAVRILSESKKEKARN